MLFEIAERFRIPEIFLRAGARFISWLRYLEVAKEWNYENTVKFWEGLKSWPLDAFEEDANSQHYEVMPWFYQLVLGRRLKYSCCYFNNSWESLNSAEERMLCKYCELGDLNPEYTGNVLDLGCGWGSLTSFLRERVPKARVVSVTNSVNQRDFVQHSVPESKVLKVSFSELRPENMDDLRFDIAFCVEMLEHIRNWPVAFDRLASLLQDNGILIIHFFASNLMPFLYENQHPSDWMAREFFSGGMMPSPMFLFLQDKFIVEKLEFIPGIHYRLTADRWLENLENNREKIIERLRKEGKTADEAHRFVNRWRLFFIGCSEFFGLSRGRAFCVYLARLRKK